MWIKQRNSGKDIFLRKDSKNLQFKGCANISYLSAGKIHPYCYLAITSEIR
jgi:hypothetical protein